MKTNRKEIIQTTIELADQKGLNGVSLKAVGELLGIKTPSLYNHVDSLEDLLRMVAHHGMQEMNAALTLAAVGKNQDEAMKGVAIAYLQYMCKHPGGYEVIQWVSWHQNEETAQLLQQFRELLLLLLATYDFDEKDHPAILRLWMGVLHGYTSMNLGAALQAPEQTEHEFMDALDTVLCGIHEKYGKCREKCS